MSRASIRSAVVELLGELEFEDVGQGRRNAVPQAKLPAAYVYTDSETIEPISISPRRLLRKAELKIEIYVAGDEDALDALAYAVEDAIAGSENLDGEVRNIVPVAWMVTASEKADNKYLVGTLSVLAEYETVE